MFIGAERRFDWGHVNLNKKKNVLLVLSSPLLIEIEERRFNEDYAFNLIDENSFWLNDSDEAKKNKRKWWLDSVARVSR